MRNIYTKMLVLLMVLAIPAGLFTGCKSSKKATTTQPPSGEEEVVRFCYGPSINRIKNIFVRLPAGRAWTRSTSEKKALSEARAKMAAQIETVVKTVTDNYLKSGEMNNKEELMKRYESLSREVVNQKLSGTIELCNRQTKSKDGTYTTYVALEYGGNDVLSALNNRISKDDMLKIDYNYEKFKKTFEEEMNKMQPQ